MHSTMQIRSLDDVTSFCAEVLRPTLSSTPDRDTQAHATLAVVGYAVWRWSKEQHNEIEPSELRSLGAWLRDCWLEPDKAQRKGRKVLGAIQSGDALEAVVASTPGAAWSTLAAFEVARRRGEIKEWSWDGQKIHVEKT